MKETEDLVEIAKEGMYERQKILDGTYTPDHETPEDGSKQTVIKRAIPTPFGRNNAGRTYGGPGESRVPFRVTR